MSREEMIQEYVKNEFKKLIELGDVKLTLGADDDSWSLSDPSWVWFVKRHIYALSDLIIDPEEIK